MIEETIYEYMCMKIIVPCYMMRPETVPESYVVIEKTGGSKENHLIRSTFAFQSYAPKLEQAAELNEQVKAAAEGLVELDDISASRYNTDYNFTNTATKQPRYQAVFDVYHY